MRPKHLRHWMFALLAASVCPPAATTWAATELFVSPAGTGAGTGAKDKPFATLTQAQAAARAHSAKGEAVTVAIAPGTYYLPETLVFTAEDSGTAAAPVVYAAQSADADVVLSGGSNLALAWTPYKDGIMQAKVPADFAADQLFVNGQRQPMARYPNFDASIRQFNGFAADAFSKERAAKWADPTGGFMHAMHNSLWGDYSWRITGKNENGEITYEGGWQNNRPGPMHRQLRFVENVFEELDAPGEWFHNAKTQTLYYYPPKDVDLNSAVVESVRLNHLVEFRGSQEKPVRFLTLNGLTFRHAARTFMDNKEPLLRSDWTTYRGGAIFFNGTEDCGLQACTIDQVGGNAVFVNKYNRRVTVKDSIITKAGASGIAFVGSPDAVRSPLFNYNNVQTLDKIDRTTGPKSDNYPADCLVEDCLITQTGRVEKQTAPVQISMAMNITVRHCSIYDVPRAGINICDGTWGGHVIEFCDVFDTVKETGDHGSFNSWGRDRFWRPEIREVNAWVKELPDLPYLDAIKPVVLNNNRWRCDHGWDIDLDDGSTNYIITNNLCLNGGIKNREGYKRLVENNIMITAGFDPHVWFDNSGDIFRKNIVSRDYRPARMYRAPWGEEMDNNLQHKAGATEAAPAAALQRQSNRDQHSVLADAMFVDPAKGDYRVKEGSPALALGFKNFPMDNFGVTSPKLKAIARTPFSGTAPAVAAVKAPERDGRVRDFLGAKIKNVVGMSDVSATGLSGEMGALITEAPAQSAAARSGLKEGDVLLKWNATDINSVDDLLKAAAAAKPGEKVTAEVWRSQKRTPIQITQ